MNTDSATPTTASTELQQSWRSLLWGGVLIAVLGVLAILAPLVTGIALSILLGVLLVVGGFFHFVHAFSARGWTGALGQIVLAVVYVVGGFALVVNPTLGLATLTILVIAYLAASGIVEILMSLQLRDEPRWVWLLVSGAVSVVLAVLLWSGLPSTATWAVGLLFGVNLLTTGLAMVAVAMTGRRETAASEADSVGTGGV